MPKLKKLIFAPFFIIFYILLLTALKPYLNSFSLFLSFSLESFFNLLTLSLLFCLTSLFFVLFVTIAQDIKIVVAIGILASFLPVLFLNPAQGIVLVVISIISFLVTFINLGNTLKSYITFNPTSLLSPPTKRLSTFLILGFSFLYFLSTSQMISKNGFEIPDALIETSLKFTPQIEESPLQNLNISNDQIQILKNNPQLLRQSGLDPKILDTIGKSPIQSTKNLTENLIRSTVKNQIEAILAPYINFIPIILGILTFISLQSLTSFISLLIYPLLWIIFYILEKTNFIKFEIEQRPVKKLVI